MAPHAYRAWHCLVLLAWTLTVLNFTSATPSVTHLRSGAVQGHAGLRHPTRELLQAEDAASCSDEQWVLLAGRGQYLLQLNGGQGLGPQEEAALLERLHAQGALVSNYLPPATWLLLLPQPLALDAPALQPHSLVALQPQHKLAPELLQLQDLVQQEDSWQQLLSGTPVHKLQSVQRRRLMSAQQESVKWGGEPARQGQVLLGRPHIMRSPSATRLSSSSANSSAVAAQLVVAVHFPLVHASDMAAAGLSKDQYNPAAAAAADWAQPLLQLASSAACAPELHVQGRQLLVSACPQDLARVVAWLSRQPSVHWLSPRMASQLHNAVASAITQGKQTTTRDDHVSASMHPIWQAGIDGSGQVVGIGDSGMNMGSCYFKDPAVPFSPTGRTRSGDLIFQSDEHRKLKFYLAMGGGDFEDSIGHGSHTSGTIAGVNYNGEHDKATGMAPGAKLAFMDLSSRQSDVVAAPYDFGDGYASYTYAQGARIHSDSWGSDVISYDGSAASLDAWTYENPDFVSVLAAGNYGEAEQYKTTITSPATAKNCIAVGAAQTLLSRYNSNVQAPVYTMQVFVTREGGQVQQLTYRVVQASFGGPMEPLLGKSFPLLAAEPINGCQALSAAAGAVVLMQRGGCYFSDKMGAAQAVGAAGVVLTDTQQSGYFVMEAPQDAVGLTIPMVGVPVSIGRDLWQLIGSTGSCAECGVSVRFGPDTMAGLPSYEDIASFSSFGPTLDGRIKPDIVAPGDLVSAGLGETAGYGGISSTGGECSQARTQGTSMACPVVAGSLALIRQYFTDGFYPAGVASPAAAHAPSGPLMKAVLLGGASNMMGNTEAGLPLEPAPSFRQGYGLVNLTRSLPLARNAAGWRMQAVDMAELGQGDSHDYCITSTGGPLSVMLVWYDPPASPSAESVLVQDLDLEVRAAGLGNATLLGNGWKDSLNPNERVLVEDLPAGPVAIRVTASRIYSRIRSQKYALVVLGTFTGALVSEQNPDPASRDAVDPKCAVGTTAAGTGPNAISMPVFGGGQVPIKATVAQPPQAPVDPALPTVQIQPPPANAQQQAGEVTVGLTVVGADRASASPVSAVDVVVMPLGAARPTVNVSSSSPAPKPASLPATSGRRLQQVEGEASSGPYVQGGGPLRLGEWARVPPPADSVTIAGLPPGQYQLLARTMGAGGMVSSNSRPFYFTAASEDQAAASGGSDGPNIGLIVGVAVGCVAALLLLIGLVVFGRRRAAASHANRQNAAAIAAASHQQGGGGGAAAARPSPLAGPVPPTYAPAYGVGAGAYPAVPTASYTMPYPPPVAQSARYLPSSGGGSPDASVLVGASGGMGDKGLASALTASQEEAQLQAAIRASQAEERMRTWAWIQLEQERQQQGQGQQPPPQGGQQ